MRVLAAAAAAPGRCCGRVRPAPAAARAPAFDADRADACWRGPGPGGGEHLRGRLLSPDPPDDVRDIHQLGDHARITARPVRSHSHRPGPGIGERGARRELGIIKGRPRGNAVLHGHVRIQRVTVVRTGAVIRGEGPVEIVQPYGKLPGFLLGQFILTATGTGHTPVLRVPDNAGADISPENPLVIDQVIDGFGDIPGLRPECSFHGNEREIQVHLPGRCCLPRDAADNPGHYV